MLPSVSMIHLLILVVHLLATIAKLVRAGGTDGGADVFSLAGFLCDDDLISHDRLGWQNRFDLASARTYREQNDRAS